MRSARLATITVALTMLVASGARAASWTAPSTLQTCAPASDPKVVFPFSSPSARSGRGAILWLGGAPSCAGGSGAQATLDSATLHSDDQPSVARAVVGGHQLTGPLESAAATSGQLIAVAGDAGTPVGGRPEALLGEGLAGGVLHILTPLGGPDAPLATADGYIGDADIVSTATGLGGVALIELREQRHYAGSFARPVILDEGFAPITALAVGMDFRGDSLILWAQSGEVHAQRVTNLRRVYPAQVLGPAGYAPALAAVLSDNNHGFAMWTDEAGPRSARRGPDLSRALGRERRLPGRSAPARGVRRAACGATRPRQHRARAGDPVRGRARRLDARAARQLRREGRRGPTATTVLPPATIAQPGADLRLAALATGPLNDFVVVLESAPRGAGGFDTSQQTILAAHSVPGGPGGVSFETPTQLTQAGPNTEPSVAIDPDTDRAVVAWQTFAGSLPQIAYAVREGP